MIDDHDHRLCAVCTIYSYVPHVEPVIRCKVNVGKPAWFSIILYVLCEITYCKCMTALEPGDIVQSAK
jgi:hypothetical protein